MKATASLLSALIMLLVASELPAQTLDCSEANNTRELEQCGAEKLAQAHTAMGNYLTRVLEINVENTALVSAIETSQKRWRRAMTAHCDAVYEAWRDGSIRGVMALACKTRLTQQRTHELWLSYLQQYEGQPDYLAEPVTP